MNVGQLKKLIENAADNTPILLPGSDHSYRPAQVGVTTAIFDTKDNLWSKDTGETPFFVTAYRENVIVIS